MRVLLINISKDWRGRVYREYPLGVGILATLADLNGHRVRIHDMAADPAPLECVVNEFQPEIAAISFLSTSSVTAIGVFARLKEMRFGPIVAGGIHTSIYPEEVVQVGADVAVIGEGEPIFLRLLKAFQHPTALRFAQLASIPGIVYRDSSNRIKRNPTAAESVDLNSLPPVNRDLFNLNLYSHHSIITSRGCPYQCNFCCSWGPGGRKGRTTMPERILSELEQLVERYGSMVIYWADDMFFFSQKERLRFCRMLGDRQLPVRWVGQLRADNLNDDLVDALQHAGCEKICIGAEAASDAILMAINKQLTRAQIEEGIRCAVRGGLRVKTWWMLGLPGGPLDDQLACLETIDRTRPNEVAIHTFVPLPGTVFWNESRRFGIHLPTRDSLEKLYYYGNPGDVKLDYITSEEAWKALEVCENSLREMGYVPTDAASLDAPYVYTSPSQKKTFNV